MGEKESGDPAASGAAGSPDSWCSGARCPLVGEDEALKAGGHHRAEARLLVAEDEHVFDPREVLHQCGYFLAIHELEVAVVAEVATPPAVVGSWMRTWYCSEPADAPSTGLSKPMTQGFP